MIGVELWVSFVSSDWKLGSARREYLGEPKPFSTELVQNRNRRLHRMKYQWIIQVDFSGWRFGEREIDLDGISCHASPT